MVMAEPTSHAAHQVIDGDADPDAEPTLTRDTGVRDAGALGAPVVLRDDPAPVRAVRWWRRAGRAEGTRREWHLTRAASLAICIGLLWQWAPGFLTFVGILSALVFVHELGHYVVARRVGMRPTEFFIGFGPTIWSSTSSNGLRYGVKALPAGGYVKIPGMGPREEVEASREPYTYRSASRRKRLAVILAGVTVNFALADRAVRRLRRCPARHRAHRGGG